MSALPENRPNYLKIVKHYEECLAEHGDTHRGVDWPNAKDSETRYRVMLEVIPPAHPRPVALLDFGCGASHLYDYIVAKGISGIGYVGVDLSAKFVELSRRKYPENVYLCADVLEDPTAVPLTDFGVMNGVFTEKCSLTYDEMLSHFKKLSAAIFGRVRGGIAFNVMSKHVDWERDDLFHLPFDVLAQFLIRSLSRNFVIRNDYGLYEYTVYVYR